MKKMKRLMAMCLAACMLMGNSSVAISDTEMLPTAEPTAQVTASPTEAPAVEPAVQPTEKPTAAPTEEPQEAPVEIESLEQITTPTAEPTATPTAEPTATPTVEPTATPTVEPTATPTVEPTAMPTAEPTATPTAEPTATPTVEPTAMPTAEPTATPTAEPTATPTAEPTATPTVEPTATPTAEPTATPTVEPTAEPTATPAAEPTATIEPTAEPMATPTAEPTLMPTAEPTATIETTAEPTVEPTPTMPVVNDIPLLSENVLAVQAMIDALPSVDALYEMNSDDYLAAYEQTQAAYEAYLELSEEEQALISTKKLEALFGVFNAAVAPMAATSGDGWYIDGNKLYITGSVTILPDESYTNIEIQSGGELALSEYIAKSVTNYGTISSGSFSAGSAVTNFGSITGGTFAGTVNNRDDGTISGGTFNYSITNYGTITRGTFNDSVTNYGTISGGTINGHVWNTNGGTLRNVKLTGAHEGLDPKTVIHNINGSDTELNYGAALPGALGDAGSDKVWCGSDGLPLSGGSVPWKYTSYTAKTQYAVIVGETANGTVTADRDKAVQGETITLTVTPNTGCELVSLTYTDSNGARVSVDGNTFTMPVSSVTVNATFAMVDYSIAVTADENGKVEAKDTANYGETVTLTIMPDVGYELKILTVDGADVTAQVEGGAYSFTMPVANVSVTASFEAIVYSVTVSGSENGTVEADKSAAIFGETVTLTITPAVDYVLNTLMVNGADVDAEVSGGSYSFAMPAGDVTVVASFKVNRFAIAVSESANGMVEAPATALVGEKVTLTVTPLEGHALESLTVGDEDVTAEVSGGAYSFTMPEGNVKVTATFKAINYSITISPVTGGTVTSDIVTAKMGETVKLTVTAESNYAFSALRVTDAEGNEVSVDMQDYTFTMPASAVTVEADFAALLTVTALGGGELANGSEVYPGDVLTAYYPVEEGIVYEWCIEGNQSATGAEWTIPSWFTDGTGTAVVKNSTDGSVLASVEFTYCWRPTMTVTLADGTPLNTGDSVWTGDVLTASYTDTRGIEFQWTDDDGNIFATGNTLEITRQMANQTVYINVYKHGTLMHEGLSHFDCFATYTVNINPSEHGTVALDMGGETAFAENDMVYLKVTADDGYAIDSITCTDANGQSVEISGYGSSYYFKMPASNVTVNAIFKQTVFTVTINPSEHGTVALDMDGETAFAENDMVYLKVTADDGYAIDSITCTDANGQIIEISGYDSSYYFNMPASNVTVSAMFNHEVTINPSEHGTVALQMGGETAFEENTRIILSVIADDGYEVDSITCTDANGQSVTVSGYDSSYYFNMPASNVTVNVTFKEIEKVDIKFFKNGSEIRSGATVCVGDVLTISCSDGSVIRWYGVHPDGYERPLSEGTMLTVTEDMLEYESIFVFLDEEYYFYPTANGSSDIYSVAIADGIGGTVTADKATAASGETVTLTVAPNTGCELVSLIVGDEDVTANIVDGKYSFTMPAGDVTITATFKMLWKIESDILYVYTTLNSLPEGEYSAICVESGGELAAGVSTGLNVTNNGTISGGTYSGTVNNQGSISGAKFTGNASVTGTAPTTVIHSVNGTDTVLNYDAYLGYELRNPGDGKAWYCENTPADLIDTVPLIYTAYSAKTIYSITVNTAENGTVTADKSTAAKGENVTLSVVPASGYELETLRVNNGTDTFEIVENNQFTMGEGDVTVVATFKKISYNILVTVDGNGSVTAPETMQWGETVQLTVTPDEGYELDSICVNKKGEVGATVDVATDNTFIMPTSDVIVYATFKAKTSYNITVASDIQNGTVTVDKTTAASGEAITLIVTPEDGYALDKLTVTPEDETLTVDVASDNSFTMPASNVTVTATFKRVYKITIADDIVNGTLTVDKTEAAEGELVTLTAIPDPGYEFSQFITRLTGYVSISMSGNVMTMPACDVEVSVKFQSTEGYKITLPANAGYNVKRIEGETEYPIPAGGSYSFTVTVRDSYDGSTMTVWAYGKESGGKTQLMPDANGIYTISNIQEHQQIVVSGVKPKKPDGVEDFDSSKPAPFVFACGENGEHTISAPYFDAEYASCGEVYLHKPTQRWRVDITFRVKDYFTAKVGEHTAENLPETATFTAEQVYGWQYGSAGSTYVPTEYEMTCAPSYIITIPASLNLNENKMLTITASDVQNMNGKQIVVNVTSENEFRLINEAGTDFISYYGENPTIFYFFENGSQIITMGVDESGKPAGTYEDTLTFTASVQESVSAAE